MKNFNKNKKWAWATMLFIGLVAFGITSCSDDENNVTPVEGEAESAILQVVSVVTPGGSSVQYARVTPEILNEFDISQAVELGTGVSVKAFEDDMFVINSSASTITKYSIDRSSLELKVQDILSFASTGLTSTRTLVFASSTRAFISDLNEGVILEFNPESMEITTTLNVPVPVPNAPSNLNVAIFQAFLLNSGKVVWPIDYNAGPSCCDNPVPTEGVPAIAVFDPSTNQLTYKSDPRLPLGNRSFQSGDGTVYLGAAPWLGFFQNYFGSLPDANYNLIRLDDNGDFESTGFDAENVLEIDYGGNIQSAQGDEALIRYQNIDAWPESYDDRWNWWGDPAFNFDVVVSLSDNTFRPFNEFDEYTLGVVSIGNVDGQNYYAAYTATSIGFEGGDQEQTVDLIRQESFDNFTTVQTIPFDAGIVLVTRLW
ncbi:MAG: hypothetical protein AAGI25_16245 [Bacteroidota bacterium]